MLAVIIFCLALSASIAWLSFGGSTYIKKVNQSKNQTDYFSWDTDINKVAGRDSWDEHLTD